MINIMKIQIFKDYLHNYLLFVWYGRVLTYFEKYYAMGIPKTQFSSFK